MKRIRVIISLCLVIAVIIVGSFLWGMHHFKGTAQQVVSKPTIVLVNEDQSGKFEGKSYNFGKSFVDLVSNDSKYNWQVVSRSVADRAYANKSVNAVIYIPQNFSQDILTLKDVDPTKAEVDYKLLNSQSKLTNQNLKDKIKNILYDFNTSIVKMYYASVADSVASAQTDMGKMIKSQGSLLKTLKKDVYGPFLATSQDYQSVLSASSSVKSQNESWIQAQNSFTQSTVKMLTEDSSSFQGELPDFTDYFDTQTKMMGINLSNANQEVSDQASSDHSHYYQQYSEAYNASLKKMRQFYEKSGDEEATGVDADLTKQIANYDSIMNQISKNISTQLGTLTDERNELSALKQDLYVQFFDSGFETRDNAIRALRDLLKASLSPTIDVPGTYAQQITDLLNALGVNPSDPDSDPITVYAVFLGKLVSEGELTEDQKTTYLGELTLLVSYAKAFKIVTPAPPINFKTVSTQNSGEQKLKKELVITVPKGTKDDLTFSASDGLSNTAVAVVETSSTTGVTVNADQSVTLDNRANTSSDTEYKIVYEVTMGQVTSGVVTFQWGTGSSKDIFQLFSESNLPAYAEEDSSDILATLSNIDKASSLIPFLYGVPGATYKDFGNCTSEDNFTQKSTRSVYQMYGNMDWNKTDEDNYLNSDEVNYFFNEGQVNLDKVEDAISQINEMMTNLQQDEQQLQSNLPSNYFASVTSNLQSWYQETMSELNEKYQAWTKNDELKLAEKDWQSYQQGEVVLYQDKDGAAALYSQISKMITSTAKQAKETSSSAQVIKNNTEEFNQLDSTVKQTQAVAKETISNTNQLLTDGGSALKENQNYYKNFDSVLANTRTSGVNTNRLFDFFANPLLTKNVTAAASSKTKAFDWRWPGVFFGGVLFGALMKMIWNVLSKKKKAA